MREIAWRLSIRYRGERYRLHQMNKFAELTMEHLMMPATAKFFATRDARGQSGYLLHIDIQAPLSQECQLALRAYLLRKLYEVFGFDPLKTNLELSIRDHRADLPIQNGDISSAWLTEVLKRSMREHQMRLLEKMVVSGDDWHQPKVAGLTSAPAPISAEEIARNIAREREKLERQRALRQETRNKVRLAAEQAATRSHYRGVQPEDSAIFEGALTGYSGLWEDNRMDNRNKVSMAPTEPLPLDTEFEERKRA
jgi:hypothetical protein